MVADGIDDISMCDTAFTQTGGEQLQFKAGGVLSAIVDVHAQSGIGQRLGVGSHLQWIEVGRYLVQVFGHIGTMPAEDAEHIRVTHPDTICPEAAAREAADGTMVAVAPCAKVTVDSGNEFIQHNGFIGWVGREEGVIADGAKIGHDDNHRREYARVKAFVSAGNRAEVFPLVFLLARTVQQDDYRITFSGFLVTRRDVNTVAQVLARNGAGELVDA